MNLDALRFGCRGTVSTKKAPDGANRRGLDFVFSGSSTRTDKRVVEAPFMDATNDIGFLSFILHRTDRP